ncbi:hypothetical protein O181_092225 [Austropuccinia psidii MF-1]|uniref:Uncharacterized protein n=1 Tax=Austropuccinia psidii MF-1 TaxID=1389203 RepID=A0A9Q3IY54_9BASI|nr:hypothetical protein [Austropuccinia psidii MF-1]
MLPQIHKGVMNSCHILKMLFIEEEIIEYSNWWNPLSYKDTIKKMNYWHNKQREIGKEEAPIASTRKPQASQPSPEGKKKKKKNWRKLYSPSYRIPRTQEYVIENVLKWQEP